MPPRLKCAVGSSGLCCASLWNRASEISSAPGGGVAPAAGAPAASPLLLAGFAAVSFPPSDLHEARERAARAARERSRRLIGFIYGGGEDRRPGHLNSRSAHRARGRLVYSSFRM